MPKMDGYQATKLIREYVTEIGVEQPCIVGISGHVEEKYRQRALEAGMTSLIAKPAKVEDLKEASKSVVY